MGGMFTDTTAFDAFGKARATTSPDARKALLGALNLYGLDAPVLVDARRRLAEGFPDEHRSATRAAGRKVYEVRDRTGAAHRGAVVLDGHGDPWLVYTERHDQFHAKAADYFRRTPQFLPTALDYQIRDLEDARRREQAWRVTVHQLLFGGLQRAVLTGNAMIVEAPSSFDPTRSADTPVEVDVDVDAATDQAGLASTASLVVVTVKIPDALPSLRDEVIRACRALRPENGEISPVYSGSSLELVMTLSNAQLLQAVIDVDTPDAPAPAEHRPQDRLHYVNKARFARALVMGGAVRGLCGQWFVPTGDHETYAELAICDDCERASPHVDRFIELLMKHVRA